MLQLPVVKWGYNQGCNRTQIQKTPSQLALLSLFNVDVGRGPAAAAAAVITAASTVGLMKSPC